MNTIVNPMFPGGILNNNPLDEHIQEMFKDLHGTVEANSCENMYLWKLWHQEKGYTWEQNLSGRLPTVGTFGDMPVCISLFVNTVNGRKFLFWHATSQVVDYRLIEEWFKTFLPKSAWDEERAQFRQCDANNFHNLVH